MNLPELRRLVKVETDVNGDGVLKTIRKEDNEDNELPTFIMRLPYPENCKKYEVRYRQSSNGKYVAEMGIISSAIHTYTGKGLHGSEGGYIGLSCFLPSSWHGKRFNRTYRIIEY
jgi:hypothetical protein